MRADVRERATSQDFDFWMGRWTVRNLRVELVPLVRSGKPVHEAPVADGPAPIQKSKSCDVARSRTSALIRRSFLSSSE